MSIEATSLRYYASWVPRFPYLFRPAVVVAMVVGLGPGPVVTLGCHRSANLADRSTPTATAAAPSGRAAIPTADSMRVDPVAARGTFLALLYGSNLLAEYEHCGCPTHPLGGLSRRATVIDRARAETDGVLVVDAGDLLLPQIFDAQGAARDDGRVPPPAAEIERRARLILAAYARMGVDAVLPAERELAVGVANLRRWLSAFHVPAVASNLLGTDGASLFERDRIVTVGGVVVGIFGVVEPQPEDERRWRSWPVRVRDPVEVAREEIAALRARGARIIVALLHLGSGERVRQLLEAAPGIDWAVQGHTQMQLETADRVGGARRLEAFSLGKLVGRLDLHVVEGSYVFTDRGDRAQVQTLLDDHRRQLADLEQRAAPDQTDQPVRADALRAYHDMRRDGLRAAMKRESDLLRELPTVIRGSWFENRLMPLDDSIPDQPGVESLVRAYDAENARRAAAGRTVGVEWRRAMEEPERPAAPARTTVDAAPAGGTPAPRRSSYAGSAACVSCHAAAWRQFQTTKHAHALATLERVHRGRDPTCVACHATGYGLPGGPTRIAELIGTFKDVGCESCHGPGRAHVAAAAASNRDTPAASMPATVAMQARVDETVCLGCHTPDQTNGEFSFVPFRAAILGPGHGRPR